MKVEAIPNEIWGRFFEFSPSKSCYNWVCASKTVSDIFFKYIPRHMALLWISKKPEMFEKLSRSYQKDLSFILNILRTTSLPYSCLQYIENKEDRIKAIQEAAVASFLLDSKKAQVFPEFFSQDEQKIAKLSLINADSITIHLNNNSYTDETFKDISQAQAYHLVRTKKFEGTRKSTWCNNKTIVIEALRRGNFNSFLLCEQLYGDPDVAFLAVELDVDNLKLLDKKLRGCPKIVSHAVRFHGLSLQHATQDLQNTLNIVWPAVRKKGSTLQFASRVLQDHKEIVFQAVKQEGSSLQFASEKLKRDWKIVLKAIKSDPDSFQFADIGLKNSKKFLLDAASRNWKCFKYAHNDLRGDEDFQIQFARRAEVALGKVQELVESGLIHELGTIFKNTFSLFSE